MNIGGPYLGQLDASLLGSPAPSWCHAPGLATKVLPTGPCTGCPVRCLACNWAPSTGPIPNDGSPRGCQRHLWTVDDPAKHDQAASRP